MANRLLFRAMLLPILFVPMGLRAGVVNVAASERGFVCTVDSIFCATGNNGADPGNAYIAGVASTSSNTDITLLRNWFEFAIPTLTGVSLTSATCSLDDLGHSGGGQTLSIYGLNGQPLGLNDVVATRPFFGSASYIGNTLTIQLNADALAAISAAQGGEFFIGGIDSGETTPNPATVAPGTDFVGDFESSENGHPFSTDTYNSVLNLTTSSTAAPEPSSFALLLTAAFSAGLAGWRQKIRAR